ncbi:MAG: DUF6427 family protein [Sphingobacteriaceae bacterium]
MIKQFRSLNPLNIFFLVLMALVLRIPFWEHYMQQTAPNFQELLNHLLIKSSPTLYLSKSTLLILGLVCLLIQSLLFNKVVNTHNLIGKSSFMPALLFVVCGSFVTSFAFFSPVMLCNFLIIWLLNRFLNLYRQGEIRSLIYDAGMVIGIGTLIYEPFVLIFPLLWISLMIFRPFNWREWVIGMMGFLTVLFFLGFYYYWNNSLALFSEVWLPEYTPGIIQSINYWMLAPLFVIIVLGLIQLRANFFRSVVHIRKSYQLLLVFFLLALASAVPKWGNADHLLLALAPVCVLLAYYFQHAGKRWFYESLFLSLIGSILYFQFFQTFNFF